MELIGINEIPSFQTLSRRSRSFDLHSINMIIQSMYSVNGIAAFDSYMIHTCKQSTAERRWKYRNYKDPYQDGQRQLMDGYMEGNAI